MITQERWQQFSMRDQVGHIGAELFRASRASGHEREELLERTLELIDLSLNDPKRKQEAFQFLVLRNEVARSYIGENVDLAALYDAL